MDTDDDNYYDICSDDDDVVSSDSDFTPETNNGIARVLLNKFKWNVNELQENWFADEERFRKAVGLVESKGKSVRGELNCSICFDDFVSAGYYLSEDDRAKTQLFEYLQGVAEAALEKLHHCAEKELTEFLHYGTTAEFNSTFREKLANLTSVTGTYFANLVKALENGLADVNSGVACSTSESAHKKLKTGG